MTNPNVTVAEAYQTALQYFTKNNLLAADAICTEILKGYPYHSDTLMLTGVILNSKGNYQQAIPFFQKSLQSNPENYNANHNLGVALLEIKQGKEAIEYLTKALELVPRCPEVAASYTCLGNAYAIEDNFSKAEECHLTSMELLPGDAEVLSNLGSLYIRWKRYPQAIDILSNALIIAPDNYDVLCNLGNAYLENAEYHSAEKCYRNALQLNDGIITAYSNLSFALREQGKLLEAKQLLRKALTMDRQNAELHWNLSLILLMEEEYKEGWAEFEWRKKVQEIKVAYVAAQEWHGEALDGKTLLVHSEQGLGDALQFVRFIQVVKNRYNCRVIFQCQSVLMPLLSRCPFIDDVCSHNRPPVKFDVHIAMMSLPMILGIEHSSQLDCGRYLSFDQEYHQLWRNKLDKLENTLNIGICWQGNKSYRGDKHRSIPLAFFENLVQLPQVRIFSLQKGFGVEQLAEFVGAEFVHNIGETIDDNSGAFVETSGVLSCLDLIISSDTSLPHLAAALGRPVWMLLCQFPDWRWGMSGTTTPWYKTMRLFRQRELGNWQETFTEIQGALEQLLESRNNHI